MSKRVKEKISEIKAPGPWRQRLRLRALNEAAPIRDQNRHVSCISLVSDVHVQVFVPDERERDIAWVG
jgi:hypothetical protein